MQKNPDSGARPTDPVLPGNSDTGLVASGSGPHVQVHPQRDCRSFYGALNLCNGREVALPAFEQTSQMTANFVTILLMLYPLPILLLLDRAPWHAGALRQVLDENARLQVMYFPVACPDLNPQEHV